MGNNNQITYKDAESFFKKILGRCEYLHFQTDNTLVDTKSKGFLFLPNSFYKLIQTHCVKRMARILQTGTKIYKYPSMIHTRLEHSKGTYHRTLELMNTLYSDPKIGNLIDEKGYQKYVIAELVRGLLHDVGHGPFSHTLETVCSLPKGFHEDIGVRLIQEYPELRDALNNIYPGLPEIYKETIDRNFLGLNMIFEGQADLDRGDFLPRDSFFADKNSSVNSKIVSELFKNITIEKIVDETGKTKLAPVFSSDQISNLDSFFENRFLNYRDLYHDPYASSYDYIFKAFADRLVNSSDPSSLRDFFIHNMSKKPEEIDLKEYVSFDDVEYLKGNIDVYKNTQDPILKKLAIMSLPPQDRISGFYYGLMVSEEQVDENGNRVYTNESDENFIADLYNLPDSKEEYEKNTVLLTNPSPNEIQEITDKLKNLLQINTEDLEKLGIISWKNRDISYKSVPGKEVYVKDKTGKIFEYSKHPERKNPIFDETSYGFCLLAPLLEANGYSTEKIDLAKSIVRSYDKKIDKDK